MISTPTVHWSVCSETKENIVMYYGEGNLECTVAMYVYRYEVRMHDVFVRRSKTRTVSAFW